MSLSRSTQRRAQARLTDADWERFRDLVHHEFILNDKSSAHVVDELAKQGFIVTTNQLEHRLGKWNLLKKMSRKNWLYVHKTIKRRKGESKDTVVIFSGRRLNPAEVDAKIRRHVLPTMRLGPSSPSNTPSPPNQTLSLYPCTPRNFSTSLTIEPYPKRLPFFDFLDKELPILVQGLEFTKVSGHGAIGSGEGLDELAALSHFAKHGVAAKQSAAVSALLFSRITATLVQHSLCISTKSEKLALQLHTRQSIDRMAAQFDIFMPQAQADDNLRRAVSLTGQDSPQVQVELLKLLVYIFSNRLATFDHLDELIPFAHQVIALCHFSGLSNLSATQKLVHLSLESSTLTAVVQSFFDLAVWAGARSFVATLLQADQRINANAPMSLEPISERHSGSISPRHIPLFPLEAASIQGQAELVELLLKHGACPETSESSGRKFSVLALIILLHSAPLSHSLMDLLIKGGADINGGSEIRPIHAALMTSDQYVLKSLLLKGARVEKMYWDPYQSGTAWESHSYCVGEEFISCLALAAASTADWKDLWDSDDPLDTTNSFSAEEETRSYQLCSTLYCFSGFPAVVFDEESKNHAVTIAAGRGHAKTLLFLRNELSAGLNAPERYITPIYAAVSRGKADILDLLLRLGASMTSRPVTYRFDEYRDDPAPSLLHLAIHAGSFRMVKTLLDCDVDVNELSIIHIDHDTGAIDWKPDGTYFDYLDYQKDSVSPLGLAMAGRKWAIAELLLNRRASATIRDLVLASKHKSLKLAKAIVKSGIKLTVAESDMVLLFRLASWDLIKWACPGALLQPPSEMTRDSEGRSYLENTVLSDNMTFTMEVLAMDRNAYDSGSLCALISSLVAKRPSLCASEQCKLGPQDAFILLHKHLLPRRENPSVELTNIKTDLENFAIVLAAQGGRIDVVELLLTSRHLPLLTRQNTPSFKASPSRSHWHQLSYGRGWHDAIKRYLVSPLGFAAQEHDETFAKLLLKKGYRPCEEDLGIAIANGRSSELIEEMIGKCWNINPTRFSIKHSPLYQAVKVGRTSIVESLLSHNADINAIYASTTLLLESVRSGDMSVARELIAMGADVNAPTGWPEKPLAIAIKHGYFGLVQQLLLHGAKIETRKQNSMRYSGRIDSDLGIAAQHGRLDIIQLLLDSGADTEEHGRFQYISATKRAEDEGRHGILQLLKAHRPWSKEDMVLSKELDYYRHKTYHPSEMPLCELVDELADTSKASSYCRYFFSSPALYVSGVDITIAVVIRHHAARIMGNEKPAVSNHVKEEAAKAALQAVRYWLSETGTPGPSSLWGTEGFASLDSKCLDCNSWMGYYFGCDCSTDEQDEELANILGGVAVQALQRWAPCRPYSVTAWSYLQGTTAKVEEEVEADGQQVDSGGDDTKSSLDESVDGTDDVVHGVLHANLHGDQPDNFYADFHNVADGQMGNDLNEYMEDGDTDDLREQRRERMSHDMAEDRETPVALTDSNSANNNEWGNSEEEWRRAILDDMMGEQEAPFFPMDWAR